ncbi:MAG: D-alanyl-D-alanine carboxypeptidase/D-alanyl-D-alanine endopeptidase, partial [Gammaproteobacteria bacterium]
MLNLFLLLIGILLAIDVEAQSYQQRIQEFLEHNFNYNQIGLVVHSLTDNKILYQHHNNKLFVPASLVKLFTLASSLEELTSKFKFVTKLTWDKNKLINHTLYGDLGLIFSGDPEFTQKNLEKLILAIKKQGINQIEGDFIVDDTLYSEDYAPGWVIDDLTWGYAAPSTAIVIDENKIPIKVNPIYTFGQQVNFAISNDYENNNGFSYPCNIESKVLAVNHLQAANDCRLKVKLNANNEIWFSGCVEIEPKEQLINLAVNSPRKYLQDLLKIYFNKSNINLIGTIIFKQAPPNLVELKVHESSKLLNLLSVMMKNSNNIYANNIG